MMRRLLPLWALILILVSPSVRAQTADTITWMTPVTGRINPGGSQSYRFSAADGTVISLLAQTASGDLDPRLTLTSSSGAIIIANDDYRFPDSRDALLEAITLPRTDTYTVTVSGFGSTTGDYTLTLLPGYSQVALAENFNGDINWSSAPASLAVERVDGWAQLSLSGSQQTATIFKPNTPLEAPYYAQVSVRVISPLDTWTVGMTARQRGAERFYLYTINQRGEWRLTLHTTNGVSILRDWTPHPAILSGSAAFVLGMLVNDGSLEFFYNGQLVGRVVDSSLAETGTVGLAAQTGAAPTSRVVVQYNDLIVTRPLRMNGRPVIPDRLLVDTPNKMAQELQRRGLVPAGGEMALNVAESFIESARPGVERLMLGRGVTFRTFAIGTFVSWRPAAPGMTGCGLVLRVTADTSYTLAYADQLGGLGVSPRRGETFAPGIFAEDFTLSGDRHHLLVIARDDELLYYLDGVYRGALAAPPEAGAVGTAVVNFEPINTACRFNDTWVWRWN